MSADDVVITGLGIVSPLGGDARSAMKALLGGESGVTLLPEDQRERTPVHLYAPVDAGAPAAEPSRVASVVGTGMGGLTILLGLHERYLAKGPVGMPAHTITGIM